MCWVFSKQKVWSRFRQIWLTRRLQRPRLRSVLPSRGVLDDEALNIFMIDQNWVVVSNIFYFQPLPGEMIHFDWYFSKGVETTNQKILNYLIIKNYPRSYDLNILWLTMAFCFGRNYPMASPWEQKSRGHTRFCHDKTNPFFSSWPTHFYLLSCVWSFHHKVEHHLLVISECNSSLQQHS